MPRIPLLELVRRQENFPSLPTVAVEILRLTREESSTIEDLASAIQRDPALAAKILKVANSSLFSIPREINSIRQAITMLGLRTVQVMALSFSVVNTVTKLPGSGFDFSAFWSRSLSTAVAARTLSKIAGRKFTEEAFVAGLLTDLGMIAAWQCEPELYSAVLAEQTKSKRPIIEIEIELLGVTHAEMSRELLHTWGLPDSICAAVSSHHGDAILENSDRSLELARFVRCAAAIADLFCNEIPPTDLALIRQLCIRELGVTESSLDEALAVLNAHICETASLLSLDVEQRVEYSQIQAEASIQLAQLSLQAEMDRVASSKKASAARLEADRLNEEKKQILEVASTDALTKVANRAAFEKRLDEECGRLRARRCSLGLILLDIDHFKALNDTYGHQAGDTVLRLIGQCLRDSAERTGFAARYGGEEFAVIVPNVTAKEVRFLAEKVRENIAATSVCYNGRELRVTASIGVTYVAPGPSNVTGEHLVGEADRQLYLAKRNGRNRVEVAWKEERKDVFVRLGGEHD